MSHAPLNGVLFLRADRDRLFRCWCRRYCDSSPILARTPCTSNDRTSNRIVQKLVKPSRTRARTHGVTQSRESRCPPLSGRQLSDYPYVADRVSTTTISGLGESSDAIFIRERRSSATLERNVATFPDSVGEIQNPIWQNRAPREQLYERINRSTPTNRYGT